MTTFVVGKRILSIRPFDIKMPSRSGRQGLREVIYSRIFSSSNFGSTAVAKGSTIANGDRWLHFVPTDVGRSHVVQKTTCNDICGKFEL